MRNLLPLLVGIHADHRIRPVRGRMRAFVSFAVSHWYACDRNLAHPMVHFHVQCIWNRRMEGHQQGSKEKDEQHGSCPRSVHEVALHRGDGRTRYKTLGNAMHGLCCLWTVIEKR